MSDITRTIFHSMILHQERNGIFRIFGAILYRKCVCVCVYYNLIIALLRILVAELPKYLLKYSRVRHSQMESLMNSTFRDTKLMKNASTHIRFVRSPPPENFPFYRLVSDVRENFQPGKIPRVSVIRTRHNWSRSRY